MQKSSPGEQRDFQKWLAAKTAPPTVDISTQPPVAGKSLEKHCIDRINEIMARRNLSKSQVMDELGLSRLNVSLWMAIHRGTRMNASIAAALEKWLIANAGV